MGESKPIPSTGHHFASTAERSIQNEAGEAALAALLATGSPEALARLYSRHYRAMLAFAKGFFYDAATAEDLVQETWIAILEGIKRFKGESSFETWAFRILSNKARTRRHREWRRSAVHRLLGLLSEERGSKKARSPAAPLLSPERWQASPEDLVLSAEFRAEIQKFIASLPSRQRQVYVLRDIEGWTSEATCNRLGIGQSNQRVLLHRARAAIYDWYSKRTVGGN